MMDNLQSVMLPVARCVHSPTQRPIQPVKVEILKRSIPVIGLRHPINVRKLANGDFEIRGGGHRHAAFTELGRELIPGFIREDDDLHAELAEIDENLCRNELTPAERDLAIARRKAVYELLHPETVHGATGRGRPKTDANRVANDGDSIAPPAERFTKATSSDVGLAERTIQRAVSRVESLGSETVAKIVGSSLDRGDEMDALAKLPEDQRTKLVERAAAGEDVSAKRGDGAAINGARALMGSRQEPDDSLDFFPTPPWATRAFFKHVLPVLSVSRLGRVREPSCGEGHMSGVVLEYEPDVIATDIHDYSADGRSPPGWAGAQDFLANDAKTDTDWFLANPPFAEKAELFTLKMIAAARVGVAVFARVQWLDTIGRYERVFSVHPPTLMAFFAERVNLCKGRWDPEGSTATAYMWLVWMKDAPRLAPMWIPPGQRDALSHPDDVARFTAHPVMSQTSFGGGLGIHEPGSLTWGGREATTAPSGRAVETAKCPAAPESQSFAPISGSCCSRDVWPIGAVVPLPDDFRLGQPAPEASPARADDGLDIPEFLRRTPSNHQARSRHDAA